MRLYYILAGVPSVARVNKVIISQKTHSTQAFHVLVAICESSLHLPPPLSPLPDLLPPPPTSLPFPPPLPPSQSLPPRCPLPHLPLLTPLLPVHPPRLPLPSLLPALACPSASFPHCSSPHRHLGSLINQTIQLIRIILSTVQLINPKASGSLPAPQSRHATTIIEYFGSDKAKLCFALTFSYRSEPPQEYIVNSIFTILPNKWHTKVWIMQKRRCRKVDSNLESS